MEDTNTTLSQIDYAMLVQYGVDILSDEDLEAQAQFMLENDENEYTTKE